MILTLPAFPLEASLTLCVLLCLPHPVLTDEDGATIRDEIMIDFSKVLHTCSKKFLSLAFGFGVIVSNFRGFDFSSKRLQNLASALSPSNIRIGGSRADFLTFKPVDEPRPRQKRAPHSETFKPFVMTGDHDVSGQQWLNLTSFCKLVGWDVVFDMNIMWRDGEKWNSSNAKILLDFSNTNKIKIESLQIGNEVNSYKHNFNMVIGPATLVQDIKILKKLLSKYPRYKNTTVLGPEVTRLCKKSSTDYMESYFMDGSTAQPMDFLNVTLMDSLTESLAEAHRLKWRYACPLPARITETATCWGGGSVNVSRRYAAGFMWLDKLGQAAQYKIELLNRQTFYGGHYGLLAMDNTRPTPGYYLSVLFKRLIEGPVFNVTTARKDLRVYAHCARYLLYEPGAVVIYFLNVRNESRVLSLTRFKDLEKEVYLLTPGDENGLVSRFVKLNGVVLFVNDTTLPPMSPKKIKGDVTVEPQSYGFIVIPAANQTLCVDYIREHYPSTCSTRPKLNTTTNIQSDNVSSIESDTASSIESDTASSIESDTASTIESDTTTHTFVSQTRKNCSPLKCYNYFYYLMLFIVSYGLSHTIQTFGSCFKL